MDKKDEILSWHCIFSKGLMNYCSSALRWKSHVFIFSIFLKPFSSCRPLCRTIWAFQLSYYKCWRRVSVNDVESCCFVVLGSINVSLKWTFVTVFNDWFQWWECQVRSEAAPHSAHQSIEGAPISQLLVSYADSDTKPGNVLRFRVRVRGSQLSEDEWQTSSLSPTSSSSDSSVKSPLAATADYAKY